jgi:hypothetical protein
MMLEMGADNAVRFPDVGRDQSIGDGAAAGTGRKSGKRPPTGSGQLARAVIADALAEPAPAQAAADAQSASPATPTSPGETGESRPAADGALSGEARWRTAYPAAFRALLVAGLPDPQAAIDIAERGLDSLDARLGLDLEAAGRLPGGEPAAATTVVGPARPARAVAVPYRGELLSGAALDRRLDDWLAAGSIEPSAAEAVRTVAAHPEWLDLSDLTFALIGAGAEMGPLAPLLSWGADVIAVDLPRPALWARLHAAANAGAGRMHMITADVTADPGVVGQALAQRDLRGRRMVLGNYVYAPGAAYVLATAAVDAVTAHVLSARDDVSLSWLGSPTEMYAVPAEVVLAARAARRRLGPMRVAGPMLRPASRGRLAAPQYAGPDSAGDPSGSYGAGLGTGLGTAAGITDSLVLQQGPSYAFAKQIQRWRATAARAAGVQVSFNVAPPSRTRSVVANRLLRAAYDGAGRFGVEVFQPVTSNALMALLLVHDLRAPREAEHPWQHESAGAAHGGLWRIPYVPRSVLGFAVGIGARSLVRGG